MTVVDLRGQRGYQVTQNKSLLWCEPPDLGLGGIELQYSTRAASILDSDYLSSPLLLFACSLYTGLYVFM